MGTAATHACGVGFSRLASNAMKLEYTVQLWCEDDQYIAHAMPVDVASSGETPEAARQAVDEAVKLFLTTAAEHGTLREVLQDAGYRRVRGEWRRPAWSGVEQRSVLAEV
jgi:predicted RNase H-like HicB family nuclease